MPSARFSSNKAPVRILRSGLLHGSYKTPTFAVKSRALGMVCGEGIIAPGGVELVAPGKNIERCALCADENSMQLFAAISVRRSMRALMQRYA